MSNPLSRTFNYLMGWTPGFNEPFYTRIILVIPVFVIECCAYYKNPFGDDATKKRDF